MAAVNIYIDGSLIVGGILFAIILGGFFFFKSKKLNLRMLSIAALMIIFSGFFYLGIVLDFFSILTTGTNMDNTSGLNGILCFLWIFPAIICAMYIGASLMYPEKKYHILSIYVILGIIFELFLFLDPFGTLIFSYPLIPGTGFINSYLNILSPGFFIAVTFLISIFILNGIGFLLKSFKLGDTIKRKYRILSAAFLLFCISATFEGFLAPGFLLYLVRLGMMVSAILMYFGLKTT